MWIETHTHLSDEAFDADRASVLARAEAAGVTTLVEIAEGPEVWERALRLAESSPSVYVSLGLHPHYAHQTSGDAWTPLERRLTSLLKHPKVVAVGEIGLDYYRMKNTAEEQAELFRRMLQTARQAGKPVVIHSREANADLQKILFEFFPQTSFRMDCPEPVGVLHCFSGTWEDAQAVMSHGFLIGLDGPLTYPSAKALQTHALRLPLSRIVLETDSPYLPPQPFRGQRNEPSHLPMIGEALAAIKRRTLTEVAQITSANARALYHLP